MQRNRPIEPPFLLGGPVRAIRDHKAGDIRIETAKGNDLGEGLVVCRVPEKNMAEAMAIVALPEVLKASYPFAALGITLMAEDPDEMLVSHDAGLGVTVGQVHAMTDAIARAKIPPNERVEMPWHDRAKAPRP